MIISATIKYVMTQPSEQDDLDSEMQVIAKQIKQCITQFTSKIELWISWSYVWVSFCTTSDARFLYYAGVVVWLHKSLWHWNEWVVYFFLRRLWQLPVLNGFNSTASGCSTVSVLKQWHILYMHMGRLAATFALFVMPYGGKPLKDISGHSRARKTCHIHLMRACLKVTGHAHTISRGHPEFLLWTTSISS